ncbi:hypothetical protein PGTUg99_003439 [Puccinia graminis f. sp. tritici]|uniref:Uncharacterized protein n=2 Tax=Puccinia graminis f. sp. tritici TaxID=56615 RepID=E3L339_PUCGT|nr:uncharacterized protein PGTG_17236 [Puccinia graminis f. sp. tritici CRL 75-36-700-3]EFP90964.2 hypothetical protein PGTG_17236 [Puccinia graminis f. sp. tritici CRL 75-36-700-3]KAA1134764.1 hypothetical protein PGTUg99_003439 [Puccinia graminis f. sp. tritici]
MTILIELNAHQQTPWPSNMSTTTTATTSKFILPHFGPRKLTPLKSSIKPTDIPPETTRFLSQVYTIIQNRPREFQRTQVNRPRHWWRSSEHRTPTRWSLYRHLLKHSSWFDNQLISKSANPQPKSATFSSTPVLTNQIRSEFKRYKTLRTIPHTQEVLRQGYLLLTKLVNAKFGDLDDLNELKSYRHDLVQSRYRKIWGKTYKAQLNAQRPRTPIMTGRFLRPSVLNGPLPRLAHQPLHISMMMSSRRKKRERRVAEHRHLKDKLDTVRQEHQFDSAIIAHDQAHVFDQEHNREVKGILDRLNDISHSFTLDKERERKVYSRELLDKIEAARRRRPGVMAERNRWKRIKTRTAELDYVVEDDPEGGAETAEGKRFRLPEPSFWQK